MRHRDHIIVTYSRTQNRKEQIAYRTKRRDGRINVWTLQTFTANLIFISLKLSTQASSQRTPDMPPKRSCAQALEPSSILPFLELRTTFPAIVPRMCRGCVYPCTYYREVPRRTQQLVCNSCVHRIPRLRPGFKCNITQVEWICYLATKLRFSLIPPASLQRADHLISKVPLTAQ